MHDVQVDVIVTEIFDSQLLGEGLLPTLQHAIPNLLKVNFERMLYSLPAASGHLQRPEACLMHPLLQLLYCRKAAG